MLRVIHSYFLLTLILFFLLNDQLEDLTQDLTVSQLSDVADYLEDVA